MAVGRRPWGLGPTGMADAPPWATPGRIHLGLSSEHWAPGPRQPPAPCTWGRAFRRHLSGPGLGSGGAGRVLALLMGSQASAGLQVCRAGGGCRAAESPLSTGFHSNSLLQFLSLHGNTACGSLGNRVDPAAEGGCGDWTRGVHPHHGRTPRGTKFLAWPQGGHRMTPHTPCVPGSDRIPPEPGVLGRVQVTVSRSGQLLGVGEAGGGVQASGGAGAACYSGFRRVRSAQGNLPA